MDPPAPITAQIYTGPDRTDQHTFEALHTPVKAPQMFVPKLGRVTELHKYDPVPKVGNGIPR